MSPAPRRTVRAATLATGLVLSMAAFAQPALADVPEGWSDPAHVPWVHLLLVALVLPIVCAAVIGAVSYALDVLKRGKDAGVHHPGSDEALALEAAAKAPAITSGH